MVFFKKGKINNSVKCKTLVECECGTHLVQFFTFDDEDEVYIDFYTDNFSSKQHPIRNKLKTKFKMIWQALRGKEYTVEEIVITKDDAKELISALQKSIEQEVEK